MEWFNQLGQEESSAIAFREVNDETAIAPTMVARANKKTLFTLSSIVIGEFNIDDGFQILVFNFFSHEYFYQHKTMSLKILNNFKIQSNVSVNTGKNFIWICPDIQILDRSRKST